MIAKIKGVIKEINNNLVLIETNSGLFFSVFFTPRILSKVDINQKIEVYTYLYIYQENIYLYGFENKEEYNLFTMLINVPNVGPKTAYLIISYTKAEELIMAIKDKNYEFFNKIHGLGKKTIYKIILELSSKMNADFEIKNLYLSEEDKTVLDALTTLGYKKDSVKKIISKIPKNLSIEEKIKSALKMLK